MRDTDAGLAGNGTIKGFSPRTILNISPATPARKPQWHGWFLPGFPMITEYVLWISKRRRRQIADLVRA